MAKKRGFPFRRKESELDKELKSKVFDSLIDFALKLVSFTAAAVTCGAISVCVGPSNSEAPALDRQAAPASDAAPAEVPHPASDVSIILASLL